MRAKVASATDPPINAAAGGMERPLSVLSFTAADRRRASAPRPTPSRTVRRETPTFLVSGRYVALGMADACGVVSMAVRSTVSCSNVLAALLEAATRPSMAYAPGASARLPGAASGILAIATLSTGSIISRES